MIHGAWCNARTFPLSCRLCGTTIFYFSCDCGCKVFFEYLGPPWPEHNCQTNSGSSSTLKAPMDNTPSSLVSIPGISIYRGGQGSSNLLPEFRSGKQSIDSNIIRRVREAQSKSREIIRIEPMGTRPEEIFGKVQDWVQPDLSRRHNIERGTIGYGLLTKQIGDPDPLQFTVLVDELSGDPAAIDYLSYTFLCPRGQVDKNITKGRIVQVILEPVDILGIGPFWCAKRIELVA